jgi:hypothetical protein
MRQKVIKARQGKSSSCVLRLVALIVLLFFNLYFVQTKLTFSHYNYLLGGHKPTLTHTTAIFLQVPTAHCLVMLVWLWFSICKRHIPDEPPESLALFQINAGLFFFCSIANRHPIWRNSKEEASEYYRRKVAGFSCMR